MPRIDTISVFAKSDPDTVWRRLSSIETWTNFSPYLLNVIERNGESYKIQTPDGIVIVTPNFDAKARLLDHLVLNRAGEETMISYRVIPYRDGSILMMTNVKAATDTDEQYERQLEAIREELSSAVRLVDEPKNS